MNALLIYLVQVLAASGLLYGYYHLALRNNQFHQYNRFYLLAIPVISIILPFLNIPFYFTAEEKNASFLLKTITVIAPVNADGSATGSPAHNGTAREISITSLLLYAYLLIASIALFRVVLSLFRIRRIIRNNPVEQFGHIQLINTNEPGTPFSFFRWLFWNRQIDLQSEKGEQVFRHELFHIEQKHSYDMVYAELLTVIGWFNPFFYLIKKELKAIHEFLADQYAINENKKWEYAEMLLMQALQTQQSLVNPFYHSHIKRRIAMITLSKKPGYRYTRKLLVLPVTALAFLLFAFSYHEKSSPGNNPAVNSSSLNYTVEKLSANAINIADTVPAREADKVFDRVEIEPFFRGGDTAWRNFLVKNLKAGIPVEKKAPAGDYTVIVMFVVDKNGSLSDFKSLTKHGYGMEQEAIRVMRLSPAWTPALQNGKIVKAYFKQPITFRVSKKNFSHTVNIQQPTII